MKQKRFYLMMVMLLAFTGCSSVSTTTQTGSTTVTPIVTTASDTVGNITEVPGKQVAQASKIPLTEIPAYSGQAYAVIDQNIPSFTDKDKITTDFETYSELDTFGRCGVAYANVCPEIMPTEERGEIGMIKPSGWHTIKYDCVDGKYLYNRCHLIAYMLAGENANVKNLITGTRYFNVNGMLPFETQVGDYVKQTSNHVLYRVTPVYDGNNLVATGVQMEAYSVEDAGYGICFNVFVYNIQPGVTIDYATGDSALSGEKITPTADANIKASDSSTAVTQGVVDSSVTATKEGNYILNTNTKKFHVPLCSSVSSMKEKNKQSYTGNRDDVIAQGYTPCQKCNP